jgi:23S rRNA G2069 N7-methylase RlmK/C1962 C5-methylase RlmI
MKAFASSVQDIGGSVVLKRGKARLFEDGNPLVYGGAIEKVVGAPKAGDLVEVRDWKDEKIIGRGFFNPESLYRVRMIALSSEQIYEHSLEEILEARLAAAVEGEFN